MNCIVEYSDPHHRLAVIQLWKTVFNDEKPHNRPDLSIDKKGLSTTICFSSL